MLILQQGLDGDRHPADAPTSGHHRIDAWPVPEGAIAIIHPGEAHDPPPYLPEPMVTRPRAACIMHRAAPRRLTMPERLVAGVHLGPR